MKTIHAILFTTLIIALSSCTENTTSKNKESQVEIPIQLSKSNRNTFDNLTTSGKIEAEKTAVLSTRMMGYVVELKAKIGEKVHKGQLLIRINSTDLNAKKAQIKARILEAKAAFENAKNDYNRYQSLFEKQSISPKEMEDMTTRFKMAEARLAGAKEMKNEILAQLNYTQIKAPFSGIITNSFIKEGALANPGQPLLALEAQNSFEIKTLVPEAEISNISLNTKVNVEIKTSGKKLVGFVKEIGSSAQYTNGQFPVKIGLEKTKEQLLSGMFVNISFPSDNTTASILIPKSALVNKGQLHGVYTVSQNQTAMLRWLRLGKTYGKYIEVLSGLRDNELYISSSTEKLYNGAPVKIQ